MGKVPKKFIFINSHPIQYFAPLYKKMVDEGLNVEVWYGSDESIKGKKDREFGVDIKWDIPLLEGYSHRFFKNYSWKPSIHKGFFGLINLGMIKALSREPKCIVIIHGWGYAISVLSIFFAWLFGHKVAVRGESPLNQELKKSKMSLFLKRLILQYFLFRMVDKFLYIGKQNKAFYKYFGTDESQLVFTPYAVDNDRFQQAANELLPRKGEFRKELGLNVEAKVILFSGKYIYKKRPMDLLKAFAALELANKALVMVGEGELRSEMEKYIQDEKLENVFLTGFVNQSKIVKYYATADLFVMCSGDGETWGLSTNEAMNFGLPIVISDRAGCSIDLVDNETGYTFPVGKIESLAKNISEACNFKWSSKKIIKKIDNYSYIRIIESFQGIDK